MFEKTSRFAEELATRMSRRGFVGSLGRWAGATALGLAGIMTLAPQARAGEGKKCCFYSVYYGTRVETKCVNGPDGCPAVYQGLPFASSREVASCSACKITGGNA